MPQLRRHAGGRPVSTGRLARRTGVEGLRAVRRHAGRSRTAEANTDRAGRGGEDDPFVRMLPQRRVAPPAGHGLLEIADHREAECGEACGHVVDHPEQALRQAHQPLVQGHAERAALEGPVATRELGHSIQHGAGRTQAERRQHDEPEEDAEDVPVRGQQRMLDHMAQQFGPRQLARVEMAPLGEQLARAALVTAVECVADVGEIVAELAKAEAQVQHRDVPHQTEKNVDVRQTEINRAGKHRRHAHRHAPHDPRVMVTPGVEIAPGPAHPRREQVVHRIAARQGLELFDQEREQDGEETHARR